MGTAASKAARAVRKPATPGVVSAAPARPGKPVGPVASAGDGAYSAIPAGASDEWANMLRGLSGSIESSAWDGKAQSALGEDGPHPARRSASVVARLPQTRAPAAKRKDTAREEEPEGMLTQAHVVGIFRLRRADPDAWDARALAGKFPPAEDDLANLIRYTRTYTARTDPDGSVRGYYDPHATPPIARFERD